MKYENIKTQSLRLAVWMFILIAAMVKAPAPAMGAESEEAQRLFFDVRMAFSEYFIDEDNTKAELIKDLVAVVDENYIIGSGDELDVMVWGKLQAIYTLEVSWDGNLMPRGPDRANINEFFTFWPGTVSVNGKTLKQVQRLLDNSFQQFLKNDVHVTVTVSKPRVVRVQIMGQVDSPNVYRFPAGTSLISALTVAGYNLNTSLRHIRLIRSPARTKSRTSTLTFIIISRDSTWMRIRSFKMTTLSRYRRWE